MTECARLLRERIRARGPVRVDEYMEIALAHPEYGYYRSAPAIGREGDFITAPEVSQMFGELVSMWMADLWMRAGRPEPTMLVELGPGRGTMMADMLRAAGSVVGYRKALRPVLVEMHPGLRKRQEAMLAGEGAVWHESFGEVPEGRAMVVANEFFDALPVRQYVMRGGEWRERRVGMDEDDGFCFVDGEPVKDAAEHLPKAEEGSIAERCPQGERLVRLIAARLRDNGGAALVVDYGHAAPDGLGDTVQAVREHAYADVLDAPGSHDISAHVNFAALARAAEEEGAVASPAVPQGSFLERLGLGVRVEALARDKPGETRQALEAARSRLAESMGGVFKAMALTSPSWPTPEGFGTESAARDGR